jgi:hypothetical protein
MIYLIDDNKYGQMSQNYKFDFTSILLSYPHHIMWLQNVAGKDIDTVLKNASCVLIHDSLDAKEDKERLVAIAKKNNVPYCIFSNGFAATIFEGDSIKEIKKDRLYNNLLIFISQFKTDGEIDLRLLSLGQNYDAEKASIIQDRLINGILLNHKDNFNYEVAFPSGSQEYKDLMELVYLSNPIDDFSVFEDKYNSKETNAHTMRGAIIDMAKKIKQKYE